MFLLFMIVFHFILFTCIKKSTMRLDTKHDESHTYYCDIVMFCIIFSRGLKEYFDCVL